MLTNQRICPEIVKGAPSQLRRLILSPSQMSGRMRLGVAFRQKSRCNWNAAPSGGTHHLFFRFLSFFHCFACLFDNFQDHHAVSNATYIRLRRTHQSCS